jgi:hypothetical protein
MGLRDFSHFQDVKAMTPIARREIILQMGVFAPVHSVITV